MFWLLEWEGWDVFLRRGCTWASQVMISCSVEHQLCQGGEAWEHVYDVSRDQTLGKVLGERGERIVPCATE